MVSNRATAPTPVSGRMNAQQRLAAMREASRPVVETAVATERTPLLQSDQSVIESAMEVVSSVMETKSE